MIIDSPERFEIGRVVSRTFGVLARNVATFLALAALLMVPVLAVTLINQHNTTLVAVTNGGKLGAGELPQYLFTIFGSAIVGLVCAVVLQAALVKGTIDDLSGEKPNFGRSLSVGLRSLVSLIVLGLLAYTILLGFVLLVVPGIILMLSWSVIIPVRVVENTTITESFGRSRALTKDHRWKILGLLVMYFLLAGVIGLGIRPLFGVGLFRPGAAGTALPFALASWALSVVEGAVSAAGIASIYFELRFVKEGAGPHQLAAAFD